MDTQWIVTEIDGQVASVSADYGHFARIAALVATFPPRSVDRVTTRKVSTDELVVLAGTLRWEDLRLFGTKFQRHVWETLYRLTPNLYSYTELAVQCGNPSGVRAVAHAVAVNPVAYIIPCHLIVPKESLDKVRAIRSQAEETTLFKGRDLYLLDTLDVGEYAYGPDLKRILIKRQLGSTEA
ncbi:MAG: methylated-DNA--[Bacteroidales bacterium]|nr:methylated-DNA--[protein]-cysteine S-methyltransferase [Bacteroidales bacterium]